MSINQIETFEALQQAAAPLFEKDGGFTLAQKGCLALAVSALDNDRERELLLAGTRRSVEENDRSDLCFRILQKVCIALTETVTGKRVTMIEKIYQIKQEEWLNNRLNNFALTGQVEEFPTFFRERLH